jgi:DNA-binding NtrC family response regulator
MLRHSVEPRGIVGSETAASDWGCDLLRAVHALRQVPAVAVTGLADADCRQRAHRTDYTHVLAKPLTARAVLEAIRRALGERGVSLSITPSEGGHR